MLTVVYLPLRADMRVLYWAQSEFQLQILPPSAPLESGCQAQASPGSAFPQNIPLGLVTSLPILPSKNGRKFRNNRQGWVLRCSSEVQLYRGSGDLQGLPLGVSGVCVCECVCVYIYTYIYIHIYIIYLFSCIESSLWHVGFLQHIRSSSLQGLNPGPLHWEHGVSLSHWATREVPENTNTFLYPRLSCQAGCTIQKYIFFQDGTLVSWLQLN